MAKTEKQANQAKVANMAKQLPWVWQISKFDVKRGPLESGDLINKNGNYDFRKIGPKWYAI